MIVSEVVMTSLQPLYKLLPTDTQLNVVKIVASIYINMALVVEYKQTKVYGQLTFNQTNGITRTRLM